MTAPGPDETALIGQVLAGRYRVEAYLGAGAMGTVYRAVHVKVGRPFAIKLLHARLMANAKLRRRFEREAELAGTLKHPNVAAVVDVGVADDGQHYLVLEYADGVPLTALIDEGPQPAARVVRLVRQLCDGLRHAHEAGLIHRDLKPDNIVIERDRHGEETARILDFGIAIPFEEALGDDAARLTTGGLVLGTPEYMAPEQAMGDAIDHRIDLFALGVICFELLTGLLPFEGDGVEIARANLTRDTPVMGVRVPHVAVDPLLEAFTRALMRRDRDARLPDARAAGELLELIERDRAAAAVVLGVTLPEAAPGTAPAPIPAPVTTRAGTSVDDPGVAPARRVWIAGTVAVAVVAIAIVAITRSGADRDEPPASTDLVVAMPSQPLPPAADPPAADPPAADPPAADPPAADPPDPPAADPPAAPAPGRPRPRPVHTPTPTIAAPPAPPPDTTSPAQAVALLYGQVGRRLKHLDDTIGKETTWDLWPKYLRIHINEALADPVKLRDTRALLEELRRELDARARR